MVGVIVNLQVGIAGSNIAGRLPILNGVKFLSYYHLTADQVKQIYVAVGTFADRRDLTDELIWFKREDYEALTEIFRKWMLETYS